MRKVGTVCIRCVLALHRRCVESRLFYQTIWQRSCHVQHCVQPKSSHSFYVQYTKVSSCFFTMILYCKQVNFTREKCIQCAYGVFLHCTKCLKHSCFIQRYRSNPANNSTLPLAIMKPDTLCSIYKSLKMLFQHNILL